MSRDKLRLPDYLRHILDAVDRIARYSAGMDRSSFENNELVQDAIIRNIEIVGEASYNIRKHHPAFAEAHAEMPWGGAYGMRNALAHGSTWWISISCGTSCRTICRYSQATLSLC
ncbi:DUF86 domain-containing protein [Burkholderia sp. L27(2015)]|jgi:uncharacterized protein with HEPN domain|uniref:HepT-like ribonuclease domain-containing protein n=1 Tax=Burkholderia sp. L27(2015) TaxID=1641858 RepID=UPI0020B1514F|nr:HepT-like ribonuclease domain-containing protein [Burkholderia sp. L27(2015)]